MNVNTVRYKRVKNLGNYENATIEMVIEIEEGEDVKEATQELMATVNGLLGIPEREKVEVSEVADGGAVDDF